MESSSNRGGRVKQGPTRDYTTIGEVSAPAFARLPEPHTMFAARAERLAALAEGNPLRPYLLFLSRIVSVQHAAQDALPPLRPLAQALLSERLARAMPPLAKDLLSEEHGFAATLDWLAPHAAIPHAPEAAEQARIGLLEKSWPERLALAESVFEAAYPAQLLGESLYVAAAVQVHLARHAALLDAAQLKPVGNGQCPACGSGPVASVIVGWASASRARYCCCSLCGTMWHCVRIKCTFCGSTAGIAYYTVEGGPSSIGVETCSGCQRYIKHLHQHEQPLIEPSADDIASFGLDILTKERGFFRATANPLMVLP